MKIQVQKLRNDAKLPEYAHSGDAGMDLFSSESVTMKPGERAPIPTGIAMAIPHGNVGLIWDKSGRAVNEGLTTLAGVIDSGYRGEIKVIIFNTSNETVTLEKHQKIAQILIQQIKHPTVIEVDTLEHTSRGSGGFGSTGLT